MTVGRFARDEVVTATIDRTATELARQMKTVGVGCVVVVSEARPVGVVTDRDLVLYVLAAGRDPDETTARDVMSEDVFTVDVDADVFAVVGRMEAAGVRRVPVTDGGELVGIVTLDDLVVVLANELGSLAGVIEAAMSPA